jgi:hypothetical protein
MATSTSTEAIAPEGSKRFFFEKKNQKTFDLCASPEPPGEAPMNEVFFASFFFRKKKTLP